MGLVSVELVALVMVRESAVRRLLRLPRKAKYVLVQRNMGAMP